MGAGEGLPVEWEDLFRAAIGGQLEVVLKWAREHDCPWNRRTCEAAAEAGHMELLQWAREHGCPG